MDSDDKKSGIEKNVVKKPGCDYLILKNQLAKSLTAKMVHKKLAAKSKRSEKKHIKISDCCNSDG